MRSRQNRICQIGFPRRWMDTTLFENLKKKKKNLPVAVVSDIASSSRIEHCLELFPDWKPEIYYYQIPLNEEKQSLLTEELKIFLKQNNINSCCFSMTDKEEQSFLEIKRYKNFQPYEQLVIRANMEENFKKIVQEAGLEILSDSPKEYKELSDERADELKQALLQKMNNLNSYSFSVPMVQIRRAYYQHLLKRLQTRHEREEKELVSEETPQRVNKNKKLIEKTKEIAYSTGFKIRTNQVLPQELHDNILEIVKASKEIKKMPRHLQERGMELVRSVVAQVESALFSSDSITKGMKRIFKNGFEVLERHALTSGEKRHRFIAKKIQNKRNQAYSDQKAQERQKEIDEEKRGKAYQQHLDSVMAECNKTVAEKEEQAEKKRQRIEENRQKYIIKKQKKQQEKQERSVQLTSAEKREKNKKIMKAEHKAQIAQKKKALFLRKRRKQNNR